jgi:hypothetical protein
MYSTDAQGFRSILDELATLFGKDLTDDQRTMYWNSLKDRPIASIAECAHKHMRFGKHFPRPFELRPKDDKPPAEKRDDAVLMEGEKRANERLEDLRGNNPPEWYRQVSPKVYEIGRAQGMPDGMIEYKLQAYLARKS